jgi:hypothetical protein
VAEPLFDPPQFASNVVVHAYGEKLRGKAMRAAVTILLGSVVTFLTAMIVLRIFFSDIKPVAWSFVAQSSERLQTAFFLRTIENLAAFGIGIASVAILTLWVVPRNR